MEIQTSLVFTWFTLHLESLFNLVIQALCVLILLMFPNLTWRHFLSIIQDENLSILKVSMLKNNRVKPQAEGKPVNY